MPELMIKVGDQGPDPLYRDGDVVCAFNQRMVRCCHAQHVCNASMRNQPFNRDGLRALNHLARLAWLEKVAEFRFERISQKEVRRVRISDSSFEIFSDVPNAEGHYIDVPFYLARRVSHPRHAIFGTPGAEIWYGGKSDFSNTAMTNVWGEIEARTAEREANYPYWPATEEEKRNFLLVHSTDFNDSRAEGLRSPELDVRNPDNPVLLKKRRHTVDWRSLGLASEAEITDRSKPIDTRPAITKDESLIVTVKV